MRLPDNTHSRKNPLLYGLMAKIKNPIRAQS
jgi:hypothetical protein